MAGGKKTHTCTHTHTHTHIQTYTDSQRVYKQLSVPLYVFIMVVNGDTDHGTYYNAQLLYLQGILQKAEVLYSMGDFETALMFFHRGKKIRPEIREFTLGIQKSSSAIENAVGRE